MIPASSWIKVLVRQSYPKTFSEEKKEMQTPGNWGKDQSMR